MASLYRLDVMVRKKSDTSEPDAVKWTKNWVNDRQNDEKNKNPDGSYKREYYADLFDSRTGKIWKVFSDVAGENRDIDDKYTNGDTDVENVMYITVYIDKIEVLKANVNNLNTKASEIEVMVNENNAEVL